MIFGTPIIHNNDSALMDILQKMIHILVKTRNGKVTEEFKKIDFKKKINFLDQTLETSNWIFKIFTTKITNLQKSGVLSFYNTHKQKEKVVMIFQNTNIKSYTELINIDNVEVFLINDIIHSPLESVIQSDFFLLDDQEKKQVFEQFNTSEMTIPKIKKSDIVARLYNAKVNDVFKIIRKTPNYGHEIYYRIVVPPTYEDIFT